MDRSLKRKVIAGAVAASAIVGAGGAIAATKLGSPKEDSQAIVNDAAQQLGVKPSALSDALKKALENRIDAEVAAGNLTKAEGDALKSRIESSDFPLFGLGGRPDGDFDHHHFFFVGGPDGAAAYLGLTEAQLRTQLENGKTLAQVAKDRGKSVDGLVKAIVDARTKKLDAAVKAGRLTKTDEQMLLGDLKQRVTDMVNGTFRPHLEMHGNGHFWRPGMQHFMRPLQDG